MKYKTNKAMIRFAFPDGMNWKLETLDDAPLTTDVAVFIAWLRETANQAEQMLKSAK